MPQDCHDHAWVHVEIDQQRSAGPASVVDRDLANAGARNTVVPGPAEVSGIDWQPELGCEDQVRPVSNRVRLLSLGELFRFRCSSAATTIDGSGNVRYRRDEGEARLVRTLDPAAIPGLLQVPRYADAMAEAARRLIKRESWKTIAADERRDRQALLRREPRPLSTWPEVLFEQGSLVSRAPAGTTGLLAVPSPTR